MACRCGCCSGACCLPDSTCQITDCYECETLGGEFQGHNTACVSGACPCDPPADRSACEKCDAGEVVVYCNAYCCAGVCQDEPCQACDQTSECPTGYCCIDAICVPCQPCAVDGDCPSGQCCVSGNCVECPSCCVIDGVPNFTKTEEECVSYCTLDGEVVTAADETDCESQTIGHCELQGSTTEDTEVNCTGGLCVLEEAARFVPPAEVPATQSACESLYDYCIVDVPDSIDYRTQPVPMPESQCVDTSLPPVLCAFFIPDVTSAEDCPEDFFFVANESGCVTEQCVEDCDACDALLASVGVEDPEACQSTDPPDNTSRQARCFDVATRVKHYAVWYSKSWVVDHYGIWHVATWYEHCPEGAAPYALFNTGPGTELKKLLAKFGIHATPTCKCNKMAKQMNIWGPDESLKHIEEIVNVMEAEAKKRKLPFFRPAGRILVKKAIRNSRGNSQ